MTTRTWKGLNGSITDPTQYIDGIAPGTADIADFTSTGTYTVTGGSAAAAPVIGELLVDAGSVTFSGAFIPASLETGDSTGDFAGMIVRNGAAVTLAADSVIDLYHGGDSLYQTTGIVGVGYGTSGTAVLAGSLRADHLYVGWTAPGSALITGPSANVTIDNVYGASIWVGEGDQGVLVVQDGATVSTTFLEIDPIDTSKGPSEAVITGAGTNVTATATGDTFSDGSVLVNGRGSLLTVLAGATLSATSWTQAEHGATLIVDPTVTLNGGIILKGGSFGLIAATGAMGPATFTFASAFGLDDYIDSNIVETAPGVTLDLTGEVYGVRGNPATMVIAKGDVILSRADNTYSNPGTVLGTPEVGGTVLQAATLELAASGAAGTGAIRFDTGYDSTLIVDAGAVPSNALTGFSTGDRILFKGLTIDRTSYDGSTLTLLDGTVTVGSLEVGAGYATNAFAVTPGAGGETLSVACFCAGTRISTPGGEVPVERLKIGDLVLTAAGATVPVKWIGRRSYRMSRALESAIRPVTIRAGALAACVPARDLHVSPQHGIAVDGVLVPAVALVDGTTILRGAVRAEVTYVHIELADHDLVIAEGAATETFVDRRSRGLFDNAAEYAALYPNEPTRLPISPLPLVEQGEELERIRARLGPVAPEAGPIGALEGFVERIVRDGAGWRVTGWARDVANPARPVRLMADTTAVIANGYRSDLDGGDAGGGRHGFSVILPRSDTVVTRTEDGMVLAWHRPALAA